MANPSRVATSSTERKIPIKSNPIPRLGGRPSWSWARMSNIPTSNPTAPVKRQGWCRGSSHCKRANRRSLLKCFTHSTMGGGKIAAALTMGTRTRLHRSSMASAGVRLEGGDAVFTPLKISHNVNPHTNMSRNITLNSISRMFRHKDGGTGIRNSAVVSLHKVMKIAARTNMFPCSIRRSFACEESSRKRKIRA